MRVSQSDLADAQTGRGRAAQHGRHRQSGRASEKSATVHAQG